MESVIRGKHRFIEYVVACFAAGGHLLIEDVPGLGKTTVAKSLARLIGNEESGRSVTFRRIQFTPDLLPYDITGVDVFSQQKGVFEFQPGPIFGNIILADEINRTTPKVQSALLEVMAERQVTVGNTTRVLDDLFFVIATQNPVESEGTFSLPVAQLDRFLMRLNLGYPDREAEFAVLRDDPSQEMVPLLSPVCSRTDMLEIQDAVRRIYCDDGLLYAAVDIAAATRERTDVSLGVSPRGSLMLIQAARALALVRGREYVVDQDVLELAPLVLSHRIHMQERRRGAEALVREVSFACLSSIPA